MKNRADRAKKGYSVESFGGVAVKMVLICAVVLAFMFRLAQYKGIPNSLLWVVVIIAIYTYIASKTTTGRYFYAVGGNEKATKLSGIDTNKVYFLAYLNMGLLAAIAGMVTMARLNSSNPQLVQTSRWMRSVHVSSVVLLLMVVPVQFLVLSLVPSLWVF